MIEEYETKYITDVSKENPIPRPPKKYKIKKCIQVIYNWRVTSEGDIEFETYETKIGGADGVTEIKYQGNNVYEVILASGSSQLIHNPNQSFWEPVKEENIPPSPPIPPATVEYNK